MDDLGVPLFLETPICMWQISKLGLEDAENFLCLWVPVLPEKRTLLVIHHEDQGLSLVVIFVGGKKTTSQCQHFHQQKVNKSRQMPKGMCLGCKILSKQRHAVCFVAMPNHLLDQHPTP